MLLSSWSSPAEWYELYPVHTWTYKFVIAFVMLLCCYASLPISLQNIWHMGILSLLERSKEQIQNGFYLSLDYLLSEFESSYLPVRATRATQLHECMIKCTLCSLKKFIEQCYVCEQHLGWGCRLRRIANLHLENKNERDGFQQNRDGVFETSCR